MKIMEIRSRCLTVHKEEWKEAFEEAKTHPGARGWEMNAVSEYVMSISYFKTTSNYDTMQPIVAQEWNLDLLFRPRVFI